MHQAPLFRSLRDVASQINASGDLDATLNHLLEAMCGRPPWSAGAILKANLAEGYASTIAGFDPARIDLADEIREARWALDESPSSVALTTGAPVILPDAQLSTRFPGYQREAIRLGYRTVVVLPMGYRDADGHRTVLAVRSPQVVDVTEEELAFLQFLVHLGEIAMGKARSLAEQQASAARLESVLTAHSSLLERVLADGSVAGVAAMVALMLPNPIAIVDLVSRRVITERSPEPELVDDEVWAAAHEDVGRQLLTAARQAGRQTQHRTSELTFAIDGRSLKARALVCQLAVEGELVGALFVFSRSADFGDLDHLLLDSARVGLSVQMMREHVKFTTEARSLEDLFSDLFEQTGRPLEEVADRLLGRGVDLGRPARLMLVGVQPEGGLAGEMLLEAHRLIASLTRRYDDRAVTMVRKGAIVVHCPVNQKSESRLRGLSERIVEELRGLVGSAPIAIRSKLCREPGDYLAAWRECSRLYDLARRLDRHGALTTQDFGPFPVLMSAVDSGEMRTFVEDLIGAVVAHDEARGTAYIRTLSSFLDHGCRSQPCADALGLHVTTLRYRLSRLKELFGLEAETPEQRFALQLALRFLDVLAPRP